MATHGDIVKIISNKVGHAFNIGERVTIEKVMLFEILECRSNKTSDIIHVSETEPVWDK